MAQKTSKSLNPRGQFWLNHVQQWQRSDATQIQYCKEHDLSVAAFRWWRRKLIQDKRLLDSKKGSPTEPVTTFTEIRIPGVTDSATVYHYEITLPNQTQLRFRRNFDAEAVSALVSLLVAPC